MTGESNNIIVKKNNLIKSNRMDIYLCRYCYNRNFKNIFNKFAKVNDTLIFIKKSSRFKCFICNNFFFNSLPFIIKKILDDIHISRFSSIKSIDTGAVLPLSFYENEDMLRSLFKIKGLPSVKNHVNSILRKNLKKKINCSIDHQKPDFKFEIFVDKELEYKVNYKTKETYLLGLYNKFKRGINQRSTNDCLISDYSNPTKKNHSIEDYIKKSVFLELESRDVVLMWTGSEDKDSLVLGKGRPFIVRVNNPAKKIKIDNRYNWGNNLTIFLKTLEQREIMKYLKYSILVKILVKIHSTILDLADIEKIKLEFGGDIKYKSKGKTISKKIKFISYKLTGESVFEIFFNIENGVAIKKLIESTEKSYPSLTLLLNKKCECLYFDIINISIDHSDKR